MSNRPWGVNTIGNMIGITGTSVASPRGWARAVPLPYQTAGISRIRAAWWVLTGRAHAVVWPKPGDLENALERTF